MSLWSWQLLSSQNSIFISHFRVCSSSEKAITGKGNPLVYKSNGADTALQTFPNVQRCHNPITVQGLFCIRKMNSFSLNAFSISSYCDISPLQKLSVITCEEGDLYSQDSQLVDPNLISRWGCKMDLIQFQSSSQTNLFFFLKKKKPT